MVFTAQYIFTDVGDCNGDKAMQIQTAVIGHMDFISVYGPHGFVFGDPFHINRDYLIINRWRFKSVSGPHGVEKTSAPHRHFAKQSTKQN